MSQALPPQEKSSGLINYWAAPQTQFKASCGSHYFNSNYLQDDSQEHNLIFISLVGQML